MLASAFLFATMSALTKAATSASGKHTLPTLPGAELAFFRYVCGLAALFGLAVLRRVDLLGTDRKGLLWRGFYGGIASTLFFLGIQYTSLTNATLLNYSFVIWGPLMAIFALNEPLGRRGALAVSVALVGVLLVTRPEVGHVRPGDSIALLSGILAGAALVQIRRLRRGESSFAIFFYFNLLGLPISWATLELMGGFVVPRPSQLPLLLAIGGTSVAAQLLMTYGYRALTAAQGSLVTLTCVIYAAFLACFFFGEPLPPPTLLGGLLILLGASALCLTPTVPRFPIRRTVEAGETK